MSTVLTPVLTPVLTTALAIALAGLTGLAAPAAAGGCESSCEVGSQGHVAPLSDAEFGMWLASYAADRPSAPDLALETLLFHGDRTRAQLDRLGYGPLSPAHRTALDRELARDRVVVEMRLVDESGALRAVLSPTEIPLVEKQHLLLERTGSLGQLVSGGKVKRVGLDHFWTRW